MIQEDEVLSDLICWETPFLVWVCDIRLLLPFPIVWVVICKAICNFVLLLCRSFCCTYIVSFKLSKTNYGRLASQGMSWTFLPGVWTLKKPWLTWAGWLQVLALSCQAVAFDRRGIIPASDVKSYLAAWIVKTPIKQSHVSTRLLGGARSCLYYVLVLPRQFHHSFMSLSRIPFFLHSK